MHSSHFLPVSLFYLIFNVLSYDCGGVGMMWESFHFQSTMKLKETQIQVEKTILGQYRNSEIEYKSREFPLYFHIVLCSPLEHIPL